MAEENRPRRFAVLIDADNTSSRIVDGLFEEIARFGEPSVRRIYGDFSSPRLKSWTEVLQKHAIDPYQQFAYTSGKNASDIALVIDAMDLLHSRRFDGFCLVSSDSDFTRLASRLREEGADVYGFGAQKTPESFRQACRRFIYTENLVPEAGGGGGPRRGPAPPPRPHPPRGRRAHHQPAHPGTRGGGAPRPGGPPPRIAATQCRRALAGARHRADGDRGRLGRAGRRRPAAGSHRLGLRSAYIRLSQAVGPRAPHGRVRGRPVRRPIPAHPRQAGVSAGRPATPQPRERRRQMSAGRSYPMVVPREALNSSPTAPPASPPRRPRTA